MKKSIKILIDVIALMLLIIGVGCAVGFTIGGKVGLIHMLIFTIAGIMLSALSIVFINGKEYLKSSGYKEALIFVSIGIIAVSFIMYGGLNRLSADNEGVTYDTTVEYTHQRAKTIGTVVGFKDRNQQVCEIVDYNDIHFDNDTSPEEGVPITIKEKQGGFGYPVYEIVAVNGKQER